MTAGTAAARMLERDAELRAVAALLADARAGRGRALVVEAPPGLGKSALAERGRRRLRRSRAARPARERARAGAQPRLGRRAIAVRAVAAGPSGGRARRDARRPGGVGARTVRAGGGALRTTRFGILHGLYWLAVRAAEREPLLLVVDDAQWADEPSLRFLLYLIGRLDDQPIAVLAAARSGEGGLAEQLATRPAAAVLELEPLGEAAVTDLVRRRFAGADDRCCVRCFELTRGNPLHVRELLAAIAQDGSADLRAAADRAARSLSRSVLARLAKLSPAAQALARAVAVAEDEVPLHLAAALAMLDPVDALAAADELTRADITSPGDPLGFVHPLIRAAVYDALARPDRALTHREAARLLAEHGAPSEQIASHLLEAPPAGDGLVVEGLRAAAREAMAHGVPEAAARYLERAWREPPPPAARPDVLAELGRAEVEAGWPDAAEHLETAIRLQADAHRRAELWLELGRTLHDFGRLAEACEAFERGAAEGDADLAVDLEAWYLTSAMILPERAGDARRRIDAVLARPGPSTRGERMLLSKAMNMRLYSGGTCDEISGLAHRLLADRRLLEQDGVETQAPVHVAGCLSYCDEYAAAEDTLGRLMDIARGRGQVVMLAAAAQLRSRQRLWTGPLPDAFEDARLAHEIFSAGRHMYLPATLYCLARGLIEDDDPDEAATALEGPASTGVFAAWWHEARGRLATHRADHETALAEHLAAGELLRPVMVDNPSMFAWRSLAGSPRCGWASGSRRAS